MTQNETALQDRIEMLEDVTRAVGATLAMMADAQEPPEDLGKALWMLSLVLRNPEILA